MAAWRQLPENGGVVTLMRHDGKIHLGAKSPFASASPPVALTADEARELRVTLGKMLAPMKSTAHA